MAERFFLWFGEMLGAIRHRRPVLFWGGMYVFLVTGMTLGLHYIARPDENNPSHDITFSWGGSVGIAIFVGLVGLGVAKLFDR